MKRQKNGQNNRLTLNQRNLTMALDEIGMGLGGGTYTDGDTAYTVRTPSIIEAVEIMV